MKSAILTGTVVLAMMAGPAYAQQSGAAVHGTAADQSFVAKKAQGNMAEVELGKLATEKATSPDVKQFGQRMIEDHGRNQDELKTLAGNKNIPLPMDMDAKAKALQARLTKLSGAAFDRAYMGAMVEKHREGVAALRTQSTSGKDPDLKAWASKSLPTTEHHLKMAQDLNSNAVGTSGTMKK